MKQNATRLACVLGFLGVASGAFGAHALEDRLDAEALGWYQTAVQYHFWHALALLFVGRLAAEGRRFAPSAAVLFLLGIALFSGSLYAMALTGETWLGAITPIGGVSLLVAWALSALAAGSPEPSS